jgi:hypothetical protein
MQARRQQRGSAGWPSDVPRSAAAPQATAQHVAEVNWQPLGSATGSRVPAADVSLAGISSASYLQRGLVATQA